MCIKNFDLLSPKGKGVPLMNPFFNSDNLKAYIENMQKPFMQGTPLKSEDIQTHVMDSINHFLPDFLKGDQVSNGFTPSQQNYQVYETHDFVIARIPTVFDSSI